MMLVFLIEINWIIIQVITPTGKPYKGLAYQKGNCGVSIVRSGEAMEKALQDCCRSMRIGKILVDSDTETHEARVIFAKFPHVCGFTFINVWKNWPCRRALVMRWCPVFRAYERLKKWLYLLNAWATFFWFSHLSICWRIAFDILLKSFFEDLFEMVLKNQEQLFSKLCKKKSGPTLIESSFFNLTF